jgi:hypothetical protein
VQLVHCESLALVQVSGDVQFVTGMHGGQLSAVPLAR